MIIVDNDDAIYGKRTDQTDLKLLCKFLRKIFVKTRDNNSNKQF